MSIFMHSLFLEEGHGVLGIKLKTLRFGRQALIPLDSIWPQSVDCFVFLNISIVWILGNYEHIKEP